MKNRTAIRSNLRGRVFLRLVAICTLGCLTGYLAFNTPYWMTGIWTGLATAILFYELIRYVTQSERKLVAFLQSLNQNDFSLTFNENGKSPDYDLHNAFNQLTDTFRVLRSDKESQHQLLQIVVEHAAVPLVCFEEMSFDVFLVNNAAKELFGIPFLQKLDALRRVEHELPQLLKDLRDGEKKSLKITIHARPVFLSVQSRHIIFKDRNLKLVAFNDVSSELAAKEAETWQKLLRVLTHEISNSAIPLSTLSSYTHELVTNAHDGVLTAENRADVLESLKTIDARSSSLKEFVQNFRSVNQIPEPVMRKENLEDIVAEVSRLFLKDLQKENISLQVKAAEEPPFIFADRNLTCQVLINLMKNAVESMANFKNEKEIRITIRKDGSRFVHLDVRDSGAGISSDDMDQIFIPFYSTKKGGSGIGLSISQQIMQKQRGDIAVQSVPGKGSVFTLSFMA